MPLNRKLFDSNEYTHTWFIRQVVTPIEGSTQVRNKSFFTETTFLRWSKSIYLRFPILLYVNDPKIYVTFIISLLLYAIYVNIKLN